MSNIEIKLHCVSECETCNTFCLSYEAVTESKTMKESRYEILKQWLNHIMIKDGLT